MVSNPLGCDLSHWNGNVDWPALAGAVSFVGIKAGEGSTPDPKLADNLAGARGQPFTLLWLYWIARAGDGAVEANHLMKACGELRPNERYCLDSERTSAVTVGFLSDFFGTLPPPAARQRFLYTSAGVWAGMGNPSWALADSVALILPRYGSAAAPVVPRPWDELGLPYAIWQRSQTGRLPGIVGDVDLDEWSGDLDSLRAFAALPPAPF